MAIVHMILIRLLEDAARRKGLTYDQLFDRPQKVLDPNELGRVYVLVLGAASLGEVEKLLAQPYMGTGKCFYAAMPQDASSNSQEALEARATVERLKINKRFVTLESCLSPEEQITNFLRNP